MTLLLGTWKGLRRGRCNSSRGALHGSTARALTTRGNMVPQTMTSEHTNQTQMTADDIVAAVPSGRETTSNICRKRKKFNNNNTERSTTEFRRIRQSPSPHPQDPGDTSRTQGRQKRAHTEERWRTPDSDAPRDPWAASPRVALAPARDSRKRLMELQTPTTRDVEADQTPEEESPPRKKRQRGPRRRRRQTFT
jgi:hypothetical protein